MDSATLRSYAEDLSDKSLQCIRAVLTKHNMGVIEASREHGEAERSKALHDVLTLLDEMHEKVQGPSSLHKGMRMALCSAADRVKALMLPNAQAERQP